MKFTCRCLIRVKAQGVEEVEVDILITIHYLYFTIFSDFLPVLVFSVVFDEQLVAEHVF